MDVGTEKSVLMLRASIVASIAVFLGVAGHVTADGLLPGIGILVVLVLLSVPMTMLLVRGQVGRLRMVAVLVGGQALIHLVLTMSGGHRGDVRALSPAIPRGRDLGLQPLPTVDGRRVGSLLDAHESATGSASVAPSLPIGHLVSDVTAHAPMMVLHLLAASLVGLWLAHGERVLWTLVALLGRRILRGVSGWRIAPSHRSACLPPRRLVVDPGPRWLVPPNARRGPPLRFV